MGSCTCGSRRFWLVMVTFVNVFLLSGVVYGFTVGTGILSTSLRLVLEPGSSMAALELILKDMNIFREYVNGVPKTDSDGSPVYDTVRYNRIVTVGTACVAAGGMVAGFVLDAIGPRYTVMISGAISITGSLLFAYEVSFIAGYALLALAGAMVLISSFRVGFVFPSKLPLVLGGVSCLFDASSVVFTFFELIYDHTGVTLKLLFLGYAVITAITVTSSVVLWTMNPTYDRKSPPTTEDEKLAALPGDDSLSAPKEATHEPERGDSVSVLSESDSKLVSFDGMSLRHNANRHEGPHAKEGEEDSESEVGSVSRSTSTNPRQLSAQGEHELYLVDTPASFDRGCCCACCYRSRGEFDDEGQYVPLDQRPFLDQLRSLEFRFLYPFGVILMFESNLFLGMVQDFLDSLGDAKHHSVVSRATAWIVPAGVVFVPLISWFIQRFGLLYAAHAVAFLALTFSALSCVPILFLQLLTAMIFTAFRAAIYSFMATFVAKVFGPNSVGRVTGVAYVTTAGAIFLETPLVSVTVHQFGGDFFPMRLLLTGIILFAWIPLIWVLPHSLVLPRANAELKKDAGYDDVLIPDTEHTLKDPLLPRQV